MPNYYRNIQIVKHALSFYIQRPDTSKKDLEQEKYNIHSEVKK